MNAYGLNSVVLSMYINGICYSYITSMSRISLLLHENEGEARGQVLITMISYECL